MSPKTLDSRHAIESCTYQLHSWKPFSKAVDYDGGVHSKRQCRADRTTAANSSCSIPIETVVDMSKLSLFEEKRESLRLIGGGKRRRRRGSRSVSGRSSDRRCCSVGASAANGTCSDFPVAVGTDSSGELFVNGGGDVMHWMLDGSSEVVNTTTTATTTMMMRSLRKEKEGCESNLNVQSGGNFEGLGNESGYGSEPGYRGDVEFGYGDEFDEEEDDQRVSFWGDEFGAPSRMEKVGENTLQKVHHRCRRRKQDCRMVIP